MGEIKFDLALAHPDYRAPIQSIITTLVAKYPRAKLKRVYVGKPRNVRDVSMGFYDENKYEIWFNGYWMSRPMEVLQKAARSEPLFHGKMTAEPMHVVTHEAFHSIEVGTPGIRPRMDEVWREVTRNPGTAVAGYAITNSVENFAETGACVEMGFATSVQREQLRYMMEG